ncbi:hypothetical protein A3I36_02740 [Candidatus Giovannonibacteria bacterium RIFCSPLOWO2_02_FULL_45_28]|uniref:Glycosyltransferase n=1 Tax=Candidatus Giovannonibacteria bacterium GW2011_GWA1_44_25 TaxID=1618645 RepID=A0A0G1LKK3_9BACT|nr:MAG: Glycosyltransferase [Parcubacteria group bacterium GW2011_GWC1_44_10]KKT60469.1 MAG: Glycosyltransferase [Candidatus Giovannonibacteria bacterium GW2011_GWA1_44_25]KKU30327.1 MAG: Glycosyltransferase [Candidatus Giovannonibacteria bacterium GW2011_GWB1_46_20]OGF50531.1 MAG: hypothetical protein A2120_02705 [Candidatus Giovannonibacteria bacterium GWA2_45_15]OGF85260.1 MAG: hypothetical protein A3A19_00915 [Candidatus Giovannonibacteria bacterium RIFCSPLOWO2_01_FULL_45_140]OGF88187.1 MA
MNLLILTQKVDKEDDNLGFFHRWLEKFAEKTDNVFVVANFVGEHNLPANVQVFSLGKEKKVGRIGRYINFYKYLLSTLPKTDAVFVHMIPAWVILAWLPAFIFRKRLYLWYTHKSVTPLLRIAEKLVTKIFTASPESCRLNSSKIVVTGHGIDIEHFKPKDFSKNQTAVRLLGVGRITPSKDYEFLIETIAILIKKSRGIILDIIGAPITPADLVYKKNLENLIQQKGLRQNISFLGAKTYDEMPDVYSSHDLLLHASETGSIDKAVLEAMACGLPVVTTSEAFRGMLEVVPKDANLIAERITHLNRDMSLRKIIVENHDLDNLVEKIVKKL